MTYAFTFDASACSGCKACQAACKDKNQLPLGVLWRRVYEVAGGTWRQEGAAWSSTVFAYNLSLSCNHCEHPKCAGVCPVDAYTVRADGIVLLDSSKCIGCGYCAWACPYEAPQYDYAAGHMTKCNLCFDNLEAGLPPACVAACPLRVLDYAVVNEDLSLTLDREPLWALPAETHPYPLPADSRTGPHLAIKPHVGMKSAEAKEVVNREEVHPRKVSGWEEAPLVAFTLLAQMTVGGFWIMQWLARDQSSQLVPMLGIGLCLAAALAASFAHLGSKRNAWRVLAHLQKSWLSREILFSMFFGAGWLASLASLMLHAETALVQGITAVIGLVLVHSMTRVYRLRTVPAWDSWRTPASFYLSAALLGTVGTLPLLPGSPALYLLIMALLAGEAAVTASHGRPTAAARIQFTLLLAAIVELGIALIANGPLGIYSSVLLFLIVAAEQLIGRWAFYAARTLPMTQSQPR